MHSSECKQIYVKWKQNIPISSVQQWVDIEYIDDRILASLCNQNHIDYNVAMFEDTWCIFNNSSQEVWTSSNYFCFHYYDQIKENSPFQEKKFRE